MADGERSALGLSIGATNLAAVTADRAVTRKPVLTLYRQRPPEVGVPSENPKLNEPGLVITDFVDRVGDPAGIPAADSTTHRSETLVADALRALAYTATDGRALPEAVAVTHPAHWDSDAVDAVQVAVSRVSEWSRGRLALLPDSTAALFALKRTQACRTAESSRYATSAGREPLSAWSMPRTVIRPSPRPANGRFSGDRIDQAVLTHVIGDLSSAGSFDSSATSAIGSLNRLRTACRYAKERLSSTMETELTAEVPGYRGEIRLTRGELDDAIGQPLDSFIAFFHECCGATESARRLGGGRVGGGGASIPFVTRTLSEQSGALVITAPRPHLTAAVGAALRAAHRPGDGDNTALAPTALGSVSDATTMSEMPVEPAAAPALAWSEADDDSGIMPIRAGVYDDEPTRRDPSPRPRARANLAAEPVTGRPPTPGTAVLWWLQSGPPWQCLPSAPES